MPSRHPARELEGGELAIIGLLVLLVLAHCLVDAYSVLLQPLWPDIQRVHHLDDASFQFVYSMWSLSASFTQFAFGYWGDRYRFRWLIWAGPALAIVCISSVGIAESAMSMSVLLILGGLGVAAFHPEAAALAGACAPENRSRAMSIFAAGGFVGVAVGPIYSGELTDQFGLPALAWSMIAGLILVIPLAIALRRSPDLLKRGSSAPVSLTALLRGKRWTVATMVAIGTLRVVPAVGCILGLAYMLKRRGESNLDIGFAQSVFQAAISGGVLLVAFFGRRSLERRVLWLAPLFAAPGLLLCPVMPYAGMLGALVLIGFALGAATPVLISYGQQLLPEGQRVASSLTMGVCWGLGGAIVAGLMGVFNHMGRPELVFYVSAPLLVGSCGLCALLPRIEEMRTQLVVTPQPAMR